MDSQETTTGPVAPRIGRVSWPVRSGAAPPLADCFSARPETAPDLAATVVPGAVAVLVPGPAAEGPRGPLASSGKTQLAVHAAGSLWQSGGLDVLAWVCAASQASVLSGYVQAAAAMGADFAGAAESVAARFVSWLGETGRPWLVVLDDLRDPADLDGLWPAGPTGRVLITTPDEQTVSGLRRVQVLPVGAFSRREALNYLRGRLTADVDQRHGAIDLATELGCEPSALAQASAVIATSRLSCREYRDYFAQRRAQLTGHARSEGSAAGVTWTLSAEHAGRLSPGGATQLVVALAAVLDGHQIPGTVFTTPAACQYIAEGDTALTANPGRAWDAVLILEQAGLLAVDPASAPPAVRMSPVVQAQVRAALPGAMFGRVVRAAADALLEAWPDDEPVPWLAAGLRSCAVSLQHAAGDRLWAADGCHPLLLRAGRSMDQAGLTGPAAGYWTQLAAGSDRNLGPGHPGTLMAGSQAARALLAAGQATEAVAWSQWVLVGRSRMLGPDHPGTIAARVSLGRAMVAAGQPAAAVTVLDAALADCERVRGADHPGTLSVRDELAGACQAAGKAADAIGQYQRILADRERIQGPRHRATMNARQKLAGACLANGRVQEAISHYNQALADRERAQGPDHPDTIASRGHVASACHLAGKIGTALQLYEQVCADSERVLGVDHQDTLMRRADLARAYYAAGRLTDATTLIRDAAARFEEDVSFGAPLTQAPRGTMT